MRLIKINLVWYQQKKSHWVYSLYSWQYNFFSDPCFYAMFDVNFLVPAKFWWKDLVATKLHLWAVGRPMIPPCTHSTHSPRLDLSILPRDILLWTVQPHLHPFHQALHFFFGAKNPSNSPSPGPFQNFQPKFLLIIPSGDRSNFPTKIMSRSPSQGPIKNFWPTVHPDFPAKVHLKRMDYTSFHTTQSGFIMKLPRKHPCFNRSSHPFTAQK